MTELSSDSRRALQAQWLRDTHRAGDPPKIIAAAQRFIAEWPDDPLGWTVLAAALRATEQWSAALQAAERLIELVPEAWPHRLAALLARRLDQLERAERAARQALQLAPHDGEAWCDLGLTLAQQERFAEAEMCFRQALVWAPGLAEAYTNLGVVLVSLGRLDEAVAAHRQALALRPDDAVAYYNLGNALREACAFADAAAAYQAALRWQPCYPAAYSNLLFMLAYTGTQPPATLRELSARWEEQALTPAERAAARAQRFLRPPRVGRRLRLGILSAELGEHVVAMFLTSWLRALDRDRFEIRLYPTKQQPHAEAVRALADVWTPVIGLDDPAAAAQMRADQLDVLLETSGHTVNRLGLVARRVAPVQCHYLGYFATTGLSEMDYFIGDAVLIPPEHDSHFVETVWRLPRTRYAYDPPQEAPAPRWTPDPDGTLWLGSFNSLVKVREESLALWAQVLQALPHAKLLLKDRKGTDPATQTRIRTTLSRCGIDPNRVVFLGHVPEWRAHIALYDRLDIALDTVPFNSATTGCEALWMGVPLVTLSGETLAGRQAASLLTGLGRQDWIARDAVQFTRIVVELAQAVEERRRLRYELRTMMRTGELCDGVGLARVLEDAFAEMYDRWWATQNAR